MEFLDSHGWLYFSWFSISASAVIYKLREFYEWPACSISYFFSTCSGITTLFLILNICYEHTTSVWVLQHSAFKCSLNQFSTALLVRLFVHWEPEQIFMGLNTEYRARWVKARVNFPITLIHIYWVCQYKLFLLPEGWEGFWRFITFKTFSGTSLDW